MEVTFYLRDKSLLDKLDEYVQKGVFRSRSHAIEYAIKTLIVNIEMKKKLIQ